MHIKIVVYLYVNIGRITCRCLYKGLTTANSLVSRTFIVLEYHLKHESEKLLQDRSVTLLDLTLELLTFECFNDSTQKIVEKTRGE